MTAYSARWRNASVTKPSCRTPTATLCQKAPVHWGSVRNNPKQPAALGHVRLVVH